LISRAAAAGDPSAPLQARRTLSLLFACRCSHNSTTVHAISLSPVAIGTLRYGCSHTQGEFTVMHIVDGILASMCQPWQNSRRGLSCMAWHGPSKSRSNSTSRCIRPPKRADEREHESFAKVFAIHQHGKPTSISLQRRSSGSLHARVNFSNERCLPTLQQLLRLVSATRCLLNCNRRVSETKPAHLPRNDQRMPRRAFRRRLSHGFACSERRSAGPF
jgi:hypothetical protein